MTPKIALLEGKSVAEIEHLLRRAIQLPEAKSIKDALRKGNLFGSN